MSVSFDQLFPSQKEVVCHRAKKLLVLAGPGTGKTEVLTHRIAHILDKTVASPREILAITFSSKAANEMIERLKQLVGVDASQVRVSTLHAESLRILHAIDQAPKFIASDNEARILMQDAIDDTGLSSVIGARECESWIRLRKAENELPYEISDRDTRSLRFKRIYARYEDLLSFNRVADMDGLVMKVVRSLSSDQGSVSFDPSIRYLLVDEYQDINAGEHQLIQLLSRHASRLFAVGDDDQSIYGWRGADPSIIRRFRTDFENGQVVTLQESARCTDHILQGAQAIVSKDPECIRKHLRSARGEGNPIQILLSSSERREAYWIGQRIGREFLASRSEPRRTVIICKRLDLAEPVVAELRRKRIRTVYWRSRGLFADPAIQEILAYLRLLTDANDNLALRICLESRTGWGIGRVGIKRLRREAEAANMSLWNLMKSAQRPRDLQRWSFSFERFTQTIERITARSANLKLIEIIEHVARLLGFHRLPSVEKLKNFAAGLPSDLSISDFIEETHKNRGLDLAGGAPEPEEDVDAVSVMSMHSAKGLTYDIVFIVGMEEGSFPDPRQSEPEQRRLMYVAMTRSKNELYLCYAKRRIGPPARGFSFYNPSRFLDEIPSDHRKIIDNT